MTKQLTFGFEDEAIAVKEPAIVRKSDPKASHEAAEKIRPSIDSVAGRMLRMFEQLGRATANEAAAECMACCNTQGKNHETHRKRYAELKKKGLIRKVGERTCKETDATNVAVFEVVK